MKIKCCQCEYWKAPTIHEGLDIPEWYVTIGQCIKLWQVVPCWNNACKQLLI
jgi:hypothetical protein